MKGNTMSSTQFWVGMLVPPIVKWANPLIKKHFKLTEFDSAIQARITTKQYPAYFSHLYSLWILALLGSGLTVLFLFMIYGYTLFPNKSYAVPVFLGLINMIGTWFIFGAVFDLLFWQLSSINFKDYVMLRQLKSGWGYDIKQQVAALLKIGVIYYIITAPMLVFLIFFT